MDTTITLSEKTFKAVETIASERHQTIGAAVEELLSHAIAGHAARPRPPLRGAPGHQPEFLSVPVEAAGTPYDIRATNGHGE